MIRRLAKCFDLAAARHLLTPLRWPELGGRLIQDRNQGTPELFALPLLEPPQSDFVGQGSTGQHVLAPGPGDRVFARRPHNAALSSGWATKALSQR